MVEVVLLEVLGSLGYRAPQTSIMFEVELTPAEVCLVLVKQARREQGVRPVLL